MVQKQSNSHEKLMLSDSRLNLELYTHNESNEIKQNYTVITYLIEYVLLKLRHCKCFNE